MGGGGGAGLTAGGMPGMAKVYGKTLDAHIMHNACTTRMPGMQPEPDR